MISRSSNQNMVDLDDFRYEQYNNDFGPLTIHDLITLTNQLNRRRTHTTLHIGNNSKQQARGICLLACYLMYQKNYKINQIMSAIGESVVRNQSQFRDAGIGPADYPLAVADCLRGLELGMQNRWVQNDRFVELANLECSWIIPKRILACASPSTTMSRQYPSQTPETILPIFKQIGIKAIIRLNESLYDARTFER